MTSAELRQKYLDFFIERGHTVIASASLLPENDPTVLFTTAGMHPLVPYLMGENHAAGARLVSAQKCIRTDDIDEVGDATHHTFFEMMGNWSLGDYFKEESIKMSFEFLTSPQWLGLDISRLAVSVFQGDDDAPFDQESFDFWVKLGIPAARIAKLPKKNNWWGPAGQTGPCGPDTEIFYWTGDKDSIPESFNDDHASWVEIWNNVFMEYNKQADGHFVPLAQKNVDTGLGLERMTAIMNGLADNYLADTFSNLIKKIEELSGKTYDGNQRLMRIIADHLKAATFIIGDDKGISPSNTDQGYIVRRLIRRAMRQGRQLGIESNAWISQIAAIVIADYGHIYTELERNKEFIISQLNKEEEKFNHTIENGLKEFAKLNPENKEINGEEAFRLFQSFGFPLEMTEELAREKGYTVDRKTFEAEFAKHQDLSRTASQGKFKGGLADASEETTKLHTAAHLLLAALRKVLGEGVFQKGSNITAERLRLDFSYPDKMTAEEIKKVEDMVNSEIQKSLPVICEQMPLNEAKEKGAMGVFDSKYGEMVKVYKIGEGDQVFSYEICGGPHVENISALGHFKILKEESSSSGVRRIKAVLE
ncbi:MAG TPA: alanine--tRNA ligase [bacterium]|nr:alanine--tRNA ligase [bacterium]HPT29673.1 alanine--tRNA ligase [bacterium]